ncbi:TIR domain-containing protein [Amycolatopsis sp. NPDC098790]|uniref:TIR domain-containing protein n=1 Tax=Amycolatopsis sp. NPDC098790 TaxID=3363939 RepID=UPI00382EA668
MVDPHEYDVAVSFSGAQRDYVEQVVRESEALGVRVFYDRNETARLWGTNVIPQLRKVYGGVVTRFVIPFLSQEYLAGPYPMDELYTAITAGVERGDGYILPVMMDDVRVPPELLSPAVIYLRAEDYTPRQVAEVIAAKVETARGERREPVEVSTVIEKTLQVRKPRIAPLSFHQQEVLDDTLARVGELFRSEATQLVDYGFTRRVRVTDTAVQVAAEQHGNPVCELVLREGESLWSGKLTVAFAWPRIIGSAVNGTVTARWDADSGGPVLVFDDYSSPGSADRLLRGAEELFVELWEKKILPFLESRPR